MDGAAVDDDLRTAVDEDALAAAVDGAAVDGQRTAQRINAGGIAEGAAIDGEAAAVQNHGSGAADAGDGAGLFGGGIGDGDGGIGDGQGIAAFDAVQYLAVQIQGQILGTGDLQGGKDIQVVQHGDGGAGGVADFRQCVGKPCVFHGFAVGGGHCGLGAGFHGFGGDDHICGDETDGDGAGLGIVRQHTGADGHFLAAHGDGDGVGELVAPLGGEGGGITGVILHAGHIGAGSDVGKAVDDQMTAAGVRCHGSGRQKSCDQHKGKDNT